MPTSLKSNPLKGKLVFLDTKSPVMKLRQQLEILGARIETFFSKDIWCVITDKQINEVDKGFLCSPSLGSKRTPFLNRTQALLQAAQRKETKCTKNNELQTVVQECKQWDIPLLSIKTASNSVSKLLKKYQSAGVTLTPSKKGSPPTPLRKVVSDSHLGRGTKLEGDIVMKLQDTRQLYRPIHKSFSERDWPQLVVQTPPSSGSAAIQSPFILAEDRTDSRSKSNKDLKDDVNVRRNSNESRKRKQPGKTAETKMKFCEICQEYFPSLRSHLSSSQHIKAYSGAFTELEASIGDFQSDLCKKRSAEAASGSPPKRCRSYERQAAVEV